MLFQYKFNFTCNPLSLFSYAFRRAAPPPPLENWEKRIILKKSPIKKFEPCSTHEIQRTRMANGSVQNMET